MLMGRKQFGHIVLVACLMFMLFGCGESGSIPDNSATQPGLEPGPGPEQLATIPFPAQYVDPDSIEPRAVNLVEDQTKLGFQFNAHSVNSTNNGNYADLTPGAGEVSWAIYRFDSLADEDIPQSITVEFAEPLPETWFLGVADYSAGSWYWRKGGSLHGTSTSESEKITLPADSDFITDGGFLYAVVLTWDAVEATIYEVVLATDVNEGAPFARVIADPTGGNAALTVDFDASASDDRGGAGILEYRWDWDIDGTVDHITTEPAASHSFATPGEHYLRLEVVDGDGLCDCATGRVTVQGWVRTWGNDELDLINDIAVDRDGYVYAVGVTEDSTTGVYSLLVAKYDRFGQPLWHKVHDSTQPEIASAIKRLPDGNLLIGGYTRGMGEGDYDTLLICLEPSGNILWTRTWGDTNTDRLEDLQVDYDGNIYIAGNTTSFGAQGSDALMAKFLPDGSPDWSYRWGMAGEEALWSVCVDDDGNAIFAGMTDAADPTDTQALILKFGSDGTPMLTKVFAAAENERTLAVGADYLGNIYFAGNVQSGTTPARVVKLNSDGELQWAKSWDPGGLSIFADMIVTGTEWKPGKLHLVGWTHTAISGRDMFWVRMTPDGVLERAHSFAAPDTQQALSLSFGSSGSFLLGGWAHNNSGIWLEVPGTVADAPGTIMTPIVAPAQASGVSTAHDIQLTDVAGVMDTGGGGDYDGVAMCFYEDDL